MPRVVEGFAGEEVCPEIFLEWENGSWYNYSRRVAVWVPTMFPTD